MGAMKTSPRSHRTRRTTVAERARLLAAFDRSSLSAAVFARQHGIHYTTFCGWRHQRAKLKPAPAFVQVELTAPPAAGGLLVELGGNARLRIESADQIALAAQLLQHLNAARPC
jgi:transposase-like protein